MNRDVRPENWDDECRPGEPGFEVARAWRLLDATLADVEVSR
jgi:hypothetical protein